MRKASRSSGSFKWKAPAKPSNRELRWKASHAARSSAWESIRVAMASRPATEAIRAYSNVQKAAHLNRACIATRSRAAGLSGPACCRKKRISNHADPVCFVDPSLRFSYAEVHIKRSKGRHAVAARQGQGCEVSACGQDD